MKKLKAILPSLALMLCAFAFPVTAHAQVADTTPPTITATLSGDTLTAVAKDDGSGVAAIYVGAHCFDTLADGTAVLRFKDYAGTADKQVSVYATDVAGNKSQTVLITNPYYVAPVAAAPPASSPSAPAVSQAPPAPSSSSASSSTPIPEAQPPAGSATESAAPGGVNPLTPDGGGTVQDNATGEEGKEFFTVTTAAGNVYYLVIDRQRGTENVYFLSPVTEADLLGLAEGAAVTDPGPTQPQPQAPADTPEPAEPVQEEPPAQGGISVGTIIFILLAAGAVGGAAYYIKIVKPRKQAEADEEYEEDFEDEDGGEDGYFFGGEDAPGARYLESEEAEQTGKTNS